MHLTRFLFAALALGCSFAAFERRAIAEETFTYRFSDDGSRPLQAWGGLLGSMGEYSLDGTLDLTIDEATDTAWFSNVALTLNGEPGANLSLEGQGLPLFHDLTSMVGTFDDGTSIHFEHAAAETTCDANICTFPSMEESMFTTVDVRLLADELLLSANSGVRYWPDLPSYSITEAAAVLTSRTGGIATPEPSSLVAAMIAAALALGAGRRRRSN